MKKTMIVVFFVLFLLFPKEIKGENDFEAENQGASSIETETSIIEDQIRALPLGELDPYSTGIVGYPETEISVGDILDRFITGDLTFDFKGIFYLLSSLFFSEFLTITKLLLQLMGLGILSAILKEMKGNFGGESVSKIAFYVVFMVAITLLIQSFLTAISLATTTLNQMVDFMQAILPIMFTLMVSMGHVTSAGLLSPLTVGTVTLIATLIKDVVIRLIFLFAFISIVNHLSEAIKLDRLKSLMKSTITFLMGGLYSIFVGFISIQGFSGAVLDGMLLRSAKFATRSFVPIVGGIFADTLDTVLSSCLLIKSGLGIFGLIALLSMVILPIIKLLILSFCFKLAAAILEPIAHHELVQIIGSISEALTLIILAVVGVAILFFIMLTIIVGVSGFSIAMR